MNVLLEGFLILTLPLLGLVVLYIVGRPTLSLLGKLMGLIEQCNNLNETFKCDCGIVSRRYQLMKQYTMRCSHCEKYLNEIKHRIDDDRKFPFAPNIGLYSVYLREKMKNKTEKVKAKMRKLEEYDKELESWENLQMKKLQELEAKAQEIRTELAKKEASL